jgi:hypothetical protein
VFKAYFAFVWRTLTPGSVAVIHLTPCNSVTPTVNDNDNDNDKDGNDNYGNDNYGNENDGNNNDGNHNDGDGNWIIRHYGSILVTDHASNTTTTQQ